MTDNLKRAAGAVLLLLAMTLLASCGAEDENGKASESRGPLVVDAFIVKPQPYHHSVTVTAELLANEQVELKAPLAGQVLEIFFEEGETLQEDAPIVRLDDRQWKAQLTGLKAELETATKDLERKQALLEMEGSTQEEVDVVSARIETLLSQIEQLRINIELANVKAPFSGTVGMRNFSKGSYLNQGDPITTISQTDLLKVDFPVAQEYRNSIKEGGSVRVLVESDTLDARIYAVNPVIDARSRTLRARAKLKQSGNLMPGTFAEVLVATNHVDDALMVPTQSIVPQINDQTLFLSRNGKAHRITVELGGRTSGQVQVTKGIAAGDTILTTGLLQVKTDMPLDIRTIEE